MAVTNESTLLGFGRFQKLMMILIGAIGILTSMPIYSTIFSNANPKLICKLKMDYFNDSNVDVDDDGNCDIWASIQSNADESNYTCEFDKTHYGLTIVTEWGYTCDKLFYVSLTQTLYLVGTFSSLFIGVISDKFGRKMIVLVLFSLLTGVLFLNELLLSKAVGLSIDAKYVIYCVLQVIQGGLNNGLFNVSYTLLLELSTAKYSTLLSNVMLTMYVSGEIIIMVVALVSRNWHVLNRFVAVFSLLILVLSFIFLPESPKFLLEHKRYKQLDLLYKKMQKLNGGGNVEPSKEIDLPEKVDTNQTDEVQVTHDEQQQNEGILKILFHSKDILKKLIFLSLVWFSLSLIYYGVSLGITSIGDINPYLIYTLSSVSELVGYLICHFNDRFGLKKMFIGYFGLSSLICLIVMGVQFINDDDNSSGSSTFSVKTILIIIFASLGKASVSAAFNSAYIYTIQMFPTKVRSTLFLLVSSVGRIGSIVSPQINLLGVVVWKQLPYLVFSLFAGLACIFIVILPDPKTLNHL